MMDDVSPEAQLHSDLLPRSVNWTKSKRCWSLSADVTTKTASRDFFFQLACSQFKIFSSSCLASLCRPVTDVALITDVVWKALSHTHPQLSPHLPPSQMLFGTFLPIPVVLFTFSSPHTTPLPCFSSSSSPDVCLSICFFSHFPFFSPPIIPSLHFHLFPPHTPQTAQSLHFPLVFLPSIQTFTP